MSSNTSTARKSQLLSSVTEISEAATSKIPFQKRGYKAPKIVLVIPAYNEEANLERVLAQIPLLRALRPRWDICAVVVNDGSTDRTQEILERVSNFYRIKYVSLPLNLGIGKTVQTGFKLAIREKADVVIQFDGDGQHPIEQVASLVCPILAKKAEVVVGSRYARGAGGNVSTGLRQIGTFFFSKLLQVLVGVRITDSTSGFRAFAGDAAEFLSRYYPDDYPEVEAYVPLARRKFRITEIPVKMKTRVGGKSSITPIRSIYYMLKVGLATVIDVVRPLPHRRAKLLPRKQAPSPKTPVSATVAPVRGVGR